MNKIKRKKEKPNVCDRTLVMNTDTHCQIQGCFSKKHGGDPQKIESNPWGPKNINP